MSFFAAIPLSPWIGFGVSLAVCGLIVLTKGWHGAFTFDTEVGPQKFHEKATPRIGGAALLLGFWAAALFTFWAAALSPAAARCGVIARLLGGRPTAHAALASAWCSPPPTGNIPCYQARHPRRHSKLIECVVPPAVPFETLI